MKFKLIKQGLTNVNVYGHKDVSTGDVIDLSPEFSAQAESKPIAWELVPEPKPKKKVVKKAAKK